MLAGGVLTLDEVHLEDGHGATLVIVREPAKSPRMLLRQEALGLDEEGPAEPHSDNRVVCQAEEAEEASGMRSIGETR